jgi:F0F1-type ATP synthase assembly protein I
LLKFSSVVPVEPAKPPEKDQANSLGVALSAGTQLVVSILLWLFVGIWLDKKLRTSPWLTMAGAILGICSGLYLLIKELSQREGRR